MFLDPFFLAGAVGGLAIAGIVLWLCRTQGCRLRR